MLAQTRLTRAGVQSRKRERMHVGQYSPRAISMAHTRIHTVPGWSSAPQPEEEEASVVRAASRCIAARSSASCHIGHHT